MTGHLYLSGMPGDGPVMGPPCSGGWWLLELRDRVRGGGQTKDRWLVA
jgi:hypothetical protein